MPAGLNIKSCKSALHRVMQSTGSWVQASWQPCKPIGWYRWQVSAIKGKEELRLMTALAKQSCTTSGRHPLCLQHSIKRHSVKQVLSELCY